MCRVRTASGGYIPFGSAPERGYGVEGTQRVY